MTDHPPPPSLDDLRAASLDAMIAPLMRRVEEMRADIVETARREVIDRFHRDPVFHHRVDMVVQMMGVLGRLDEAGEAMVRTAAGFALIVAEKDGLT